MIRTRRIWEDACLNVELSEVSSGAERLFWRMLAKTDDYGNLPASPKWLKAACVPLCDTTAEEVETFRKELEERELLVTYEVHGSLYARFPSFHRRQPFRHNYTKRRLYPGPSGEQPDNLAIPRHEITPRSAHRRPAPAGDGPNSAQRAADTAPSGADTAPSGAQKKKEKEKKKKKENVTESSQTETAVPAIGTPLRPIGTPDGEHRKPIQGTLNLLMAAYRTKQPDSVVSPQKLRHWIKADLTRGIPAGEIEAAILNSRAGLYYHDIMNPVRKQFEAHRHAEKRAPPAPVVRELVSTISGGKKVTANRAADKPGLDPDVRKMLAEFRSRYGGAR